MKLTKPIDRKGKVRKYYANMLRQNRAIGIANIGIACAMGVAEWATIASTTTLTPIRYATGGYLQGNKADINVEAEEALQSLRSVGKALAMVQNAKNTADAIKQIAKGMKTPKRYRK